MSLRGKQWYGYFRQTVIDPETNEIRVKKPCTKLGLKSQMTKSEARKTLQSVITKQTGQNPGGKVRKDDSVTFEWFVRNRYFPLREGDWRPKTAKMKMIQIEQDLLVKFENESLD